MKLRFECRNEQCPALIEYRPTGAGDESFACPRCDRPYEVHQTQALRGGEALRECSMCGGSECFIRKNFPQKIGLLIVVIAAAISVFSLQRNPALAYGVLAASVLIDLIIYFLIGTVTVCYRCRTEYWGLTRNNEHGWFDLATSDKYL